MFGLDNKGWGTRTMIILTCIILIALFTATFYVTALYSNIENKANKKSNNKQTEIKKEQNNDIYYQYELIMAKGGIIYAKNHELEPTSDYYVVTYSELVNEEYFDEIKDMKDNKECDGYVQIYSIISGSYSSKAYLKCSNYTTEGYDVNESYE